MTSPILISLLEICIALVDAKCVDGPARRGRAVNAAGIADRRAGPVGSLCLELCAKDFASEASRLCWPSSPSSPSSPSCSDKRLSPRLSPISRNSSNDSSDSNDAAPNSPPANREGSSPLLHRTTYASVRKYSPPFAADPALHGTCRESLSALQRPEARPPRHGKISTL